MENRPCGQTQRTVLAMVLGQAAEKKGAPDEPDEPCWAGGSNVYALAGPPPCINAKGLALVRTRGLALLTSCLILAYRRKRTSHFFFDFRLLDSVGCRRG